MVDKTRIECPDLSTHRTTTELLSMLFKVKDFSFINKDRGDNFNPPDFSKYITALSEKRGKSHESIINGAGIEKTYGHKLFKGSRKPSRDTVIQLAFGFGASFEETQEMLRAARKSTLYPRILRDSIIIFCLVHNISFVDTQIKLYEEGLPILGEGNRNE